MDASKAVGMMLTPKKGSQNKKGQTVINVFFIIAIIGFVFFLLPGINDAIANSGADGFALAVFQLIPLILIVILAVGLIYYMLR